jgi:hypothetical protein
VSAAAILECGARRRRLEHCEVPAKPNDLNALQKLLFYLVPERKPPLSKAGINKINMLWLLND